MARTCPAFLIAQNDSRLATVASQNSGTKETPNNLFANFSCCLGERKRPSSYAGQRFHPFSPCFVLRATRGSRKIRAGRYSMERSGGGEENPVVIRLKRSPILRPGRSRWAFSCVLVCRPKTMEILQSKQEEWL